MTSLRSLALGTIGGMAGGWVGYQVFFWLAGQGFYALAVPGAAVGLCAGLLAREGSLPLAAVSTALALGAGFYTEWRFAPFVADGSFGYFLTHVASLKPVTLVMIVAGAAVAFWLSIRSSSRGR